MRRMLVIAYLTVVLIGSCKGNDTQNSGTETQAAVDTGAADTTATIAPPKPAQLHRGWIAIVSRQGGPPAFFARILISGDDMVVRDNAGSGFPVSMRAAAEHIHGPTWHFNAEETSRSDGTRKWHCASSGNLIGSMEWVRDGKTTAYIIDGAELSESPFDGVWILSLSNERRPEKSLSGRASFDRGALTLTIADKTWSRLVYLVRPPSAQVDFLTTPPGGLGDVIWNGYLEDSSGRMVGWDAVKPDGQYTLRGTIRITSRGKTTEYEVRGSRTGDSSA